MRRVINLENSFYHKKYKEIYKLLFMADLDEISDHSNWHKKYKDYVDMKRPLWIIVESKILNKRMWITHDFGSLGITTAQLDLDINSRAYHDSYERKYFRTQKEMFEYLEKLLEPCLKEYREEEKFQENIKVWKESLKFAKERIIGFYDKQKTSDDVTYITLETVGKKYSKKLANVMFDLGYGEWVFNDSGTLEKMQEQMIDTLEDDKDVNEYLEDKNLTREQLYREIKENFLEEEIGKYLEDNGVDIGMILEETKEDMINQVRKGMIDNYSYKYIIWDSGDLEGLVEELPKECFISEHVNENIEIEGEEL